jgi:hypothetical protein
MATVREEKDKIIISPKNETQRIVILNKARDFNIVIYPISQGVKSTPNQITIANYTIENTIQYGKINKDQVLDIYTVCKKTHFSPTKKTRNKIRNFFSQSVEYSPKNQLVDKIKIHDGEYYWKNINHDDKTTLYIILQNGMYDAVQKTNHNTF